jgi:hypothetical protein
MALASEGEGVRALPLKMCAEDGCGRRQWTSEKSGKRFVCSAYCEEHANVPMFDVPAVRVGPTGRHGPAATFRAEVERQRLARERQRQ